MLPLAKHQGGFGLCIVVAGGRATDEHGGATVPAQRVLQDASHFAVTIRHVGFLQRDKKKGGEGRKRLRNGEKGIKTQGLKGCGTHSELLHQCTPVFLFQD